MSGAHWYEQPRVEVAVSIADIAAKVVLAVLLAVVLVDPGWGNLEGKAPVTRAITYPLIALAVPLWRLVRRSTTRYPWTADLLLTLTGFADILGNRLDLYDQVVWFDDWIHFMNIGLITTAVLCLAPPASERLLPLLERSTGVGMTVALGWEVFEYVSFVTRSDEYRGAYADTVGDLSLGWCGAATAAAAYYLAHRQRRTPELDRPPGVTTRR